MPEGKSHIEFVDATNVSIEYEMTVSIANYENIKPKIKLMCPSDKIEENLKIARLILHDEYKKIKHIGESK